MLMVSTKPTIYKIHFLEKQRNLK